MNRSASLAPEYSTSLAERIRATKSCWVAIPAASGTYNLNGGLLSVAALGIGSGSGNFNINGGTLQSGGSLTVPINLAGSATFDIAGNSMTIVNSLTGSGSLTKINAGTLTLESINVYTGGTTVAGGARSFRGRDTRLRPVNVTGGTLDATQTPLAVSSLTIGTQALNLVMGNVLTATGTVSFGGTLNVSGSAGGSPIDLMNYAASTGKPANAFIPSGYALEFSSMEMFLAQVAGGVSVWSASPSGSWLLATNWATGFVPNGTTYGAQFSQPTASPVNVTLDGQETVSTLIFGNSASSITGYILNPGNGGSLILAGSAGSYDKRERRQPRDCRTRRVVEQPFGDDIRRRDAQHQRGHLADRYQRVDNDGGRNANLGGQQQLYRGDERPRRHAPDRQRGGQWNVRNGQLFRCRRCETLPQLRDCRSGRRRHLVEPA